MRQLEDAKRLRQYLEFCERQEQLELFRSLFYDKRYFENWKSEQGIQKDEAVWQQFFELNPWVFGLGLTPISLSSLPEHKLEQVVRGSSVAIEGKRADALMHTNGRLSALCIVEIKKHTTDLLQPNSYRRGAWSVSGEVTGAVAQCHATVQAAMNELRTKFELKDWNGDPTGDEFFLYQPRSFLVVGSLEEFATEHGTNETKFRSFELFRRNLATPEILTFDELYQRAKATVELKESGRF